jgi:hypothetical protein
VANAEWRYRSKIGAQGKGEKERKKYGKETFVLEYLPVIVDLQNPL